ncbi:unnamed protein product [Caenorhabditis sp. 36 PRJEB53466]|nr:unnamed protein product [Caenorhabditis sp. 36 PRJEB53466]
MLLIIFLFPLVTLAQWGTPPPIVTNEQCQQEFQLIVNCSKYFSDIENSPKFDFTWDQAIIDDIEFVLGCSGKLSCNSSRIYQSWLYNQKWILKQIHGNLSLCVGIDTWDEMRICRVEVELLPDLEGVPDAVKLICNRIDSAFPCAWGIVEKLEHCNYQERNLFKKFHFKHVDLYPTTIMKRGMVCDLILLHLVVLLQLGVATNAYKTTNPDPIVCSMRNMSLVEKDTKTISYEWPEECEVFRGILHLHLIDLSSASFINLRKIEGRLLVISTDLQALPRMPNLTTIESISGLPGVTILNNGQLRDIRGLVNYQKEVRVYGSAMPVFISGNPFLDTINYPKLFHKPISPISCEKRLTPNYNIVFAEAQSLGVVILTLLLSITTFLYPLSMGNANIYFVPGYHKA